jgi:hypothetical protein
LLLHLFIKPLPTINFSTKFLHSHIKLQIYLLITPLNSYSFSRINLTILSLSFFLQNHSFLISINSLYLFTSFSPPNLYCYSSQMKTLNNPYYSITTIITTNTIPKPKYSNSLFNFLIINPFFSFFNYYFVKSNSHSPKKHCFSFSFLKDSPIIN